MSSGKVTESSRQNLDFEQAHQWCLELRGILGNRVKQKLGRGDAKQLAEAESKVYERLKELHKLFPEGLPQEARALEAQYSKLAEHGQGLRQEYLGIEQLIEDQKKKREQLQKKRGFLDKVKRDTSRVEDIDAEILRLEQLRKDKKREIATQSQKFIDVAGEIKEKVDDRIKQKEDYRKDLQDKVKNPQAIKALLNAQAEWKKQRKTAEKLVEYFRANCDSEIATLATKQFDAAVVDLFTIYSVEDAQRLLQPMADFVVTYGANGKKGQYETARKQFEKVYKTAAQWMSKAQEVAEGTELIECLKVFTEGQTQSLSKNWVAADEKINARLVERLKSVVQVGANGKVAWQRASEELQKIKQQLDAIADPAFTILALTPLGEACKLADQRDFLAAAEKFHATKPAAQAVLEVADQVAGKHRSLVDVRDAILELITMIPHGPLTMLANQFQSELLSLPDNFWDQRHQPTVAKLDELFQKQDTRLAEIKRTIQSYTDPANAQSNAQLVEDIKNGHNLEASMKVIGSLIATVDPVIQEYEAVFYDPSGSQSAEPLITWKKHLRDATDFHQELKQGKLTDPNAIKGEYELHTHNLDGLAKTIREAMNRQATAISEARTKLTTILKWFKTELFVTRLDTFKEATWHKEAQQEFAELQAMATTDNLALLQQLLPRAEKIQQRCAAVLKAMPQKALDGLLEPDVTSQTAIFDGTAAQINYDNLKLQLKSVRSSLKNKDRKIYVPRKVEQVAEKLSSADAALRSDGYVGLVDPAVLQKHETAVAEVVTAREELRQHFTLVKSRRDALQQRLVQFRTRITNELEPAIEKSGGAKVSGEHLPLMKAAQAMDLRLNTEDAREFAAIEVEIGMLGDELTLLLLAADEPGGLKEQVDAHRQGEANKREGIDQKIKARVEYETKRQEFDVIWKELRSLKDVDPTEKATIKTVKDQATEATKSKPENWAKAAKDIKLALLLATRLKKDPLASQTTDRGREHLKELTPRWINGVSRLRATVNDGLKEGIVASCTEDTNVADAAGVGRLFSSTIGQKFDFGTLKKEDFLAELLVLQRKAPLKSEAKAADRKEKKKAREQALVKVRRYKHMIQKDPIYQDLLFKKNPWSNKGGHVDGLPLMRALNDLELNVERGIY